MSEFPQSGSEDVIRITKEEALAPHVDDLLKRQMSLRGEAGITRDRKRGWYYQSWFVLLVAGALASVAAWALIEPYFDDMLYVQGAVQRVDTRQGVLPRITSNDKHFELDLTATGRVEINGQDIWLLELTKLLRPDGSTESFDPATLKEGDEIGAYVEYEEIGTKSIALAHFIVRAPPTRSSDAAPLSLRQLSARSHAAAMLLFPVVAAFIGLAIGAADGVICRLLRRALLAGGVGLVVGFIGGFVSSVVAGLIYLPLNALALQQTGASAFGLSPFGFFVQMSGRALAWCAAGMAMGLGQGIALRSGRLLLYGFLGGIIGGLLGGLLFDPIDLLLLGFDKTSAHWSRLIGFIVIGSSVGAMIGVVELLARDAWLRMTAGPVAGKEFLLFKDTMTVGASPRSDIYLFNDSDVAPQHAVVRAVGDSYEIESRNRQIPVNLNGRPTQRARLHHGDQIALGRTVFVFQKRRG